jgi:hypothetical protein
MSSTSISHLGSFPWSTPDAERQYPAPPAVMLTDGTISPVVMMKPTADPVVAALRLIASWRAKTGNMPAAAPAVSKLSVDGRKIARTVAAWHCRQSDVARGGLRKHAI